MISELIIKWVKYLFRGEIKKNKYEEIYLILLVVRKSDIVMSYYYRFIRKYLTKETDI